MADFDLQSLLSQYGNMGPSEEDKQRARTMALAAAGFGILGAHGVNGMQAIGQGGGQGILAYDQGLKDAQAQRMQSLQGALLAQKAAKESQFQNMAMGLLGGGDAGLSGQPAPSSPASVAPPSAAGSPAGAPSAAMPSGGQPPPMGSVPSWANPNSELAMALMGKKDVADVMHRNASITQGPNGTLLRNGSLVGQVTPQGTIIFENGDPSKPKFYSQPQEALAAASQQAGATAGATTSATEAAKAPYTPASLNLPNGGTQQVMLDQLQSILRGQNGGPASLAGGLAGQSPSASATAQNTKIAEGQANDYIGIVDAEKNAPSNIGKYNLMKTYLAKVDTGKAAPSVQSLKAYASYFAPDLAKSWTKDVPYAQAASALSNEIALQLRNPASGAGMPGSMSNSDRDFLTSMTASAANDPRAIPMMLDARIALEKRNQEIGSLARTYRQQNGKIDEGFYQQVQDFADSHPLFPKNLTGDTGGAKAATASPGTTGTYKGKPVVMGPDGKWKYQ